MVSAGRCLLFVLALLGPELAAAQWNVEVEPVAAGEPDRRIAVGRNRQGDRLRISRTGEDVVQAVFSLRPGLSTLARGCPSYRVDDQAPRALVVDAGALCEPDGRSVTFSLGKLADGRIDSEALLELMNGSRIRFIYHLQGAGYDQAAFSLAGSKQAIIDVLGDDVRVNGNGH